jgi:hypothetical protein
VSAADPVGVGRQRTPDRGVSDQGARQEGADADRHEVEDDRQEAVSRESSDPGRAKSRRPSRATDRPVVEVAELARDPITTARSCPGSRSAASSLLVQVTVDPTAHGATALSGQR